MSMFDDDELAEPHRIANLKCMATVTEFPEEIPERLTNGECEALRNRVRMHDSNRTIREFKRSNPTEVVKPTVKDYRFFYVIRISGNHFKTGIADDVGKRLRNYRCSNRGAVVVDTWPCPYDTAQEKTVQQKMRSHKSCTWAGGETFTVHDEGAFIRELKRLFGEPQSEPSAETPQNRTTFWTSLIDLFRETR